MTTPNQVNNIAFAEGFQEGVNYQAAQDMGYAVGYPTLPGMYYPLAQQGTPQAYVGQSYQGYVPSSGLYANQAYTNALYNEAYNNPLYNPLSVPPYM